MKQKSQKIAFYLLIGGFFDFAIHRMPNLTLVTNDFLRFICVLTHSFNTWIVLEILLWNSFPHGVLLQMEAVPVMKVLYVCNLIYAPVWLYDIRVVSEQALIDNPSPMVDLFKMRVSETNKHFVDLYA